MTKQLWSINALATEFDKDRRTVALALKDVRPDGRLKGHAAWHIETALAALRPVLNEPTRLPKYPARFAVTLAKVDDPGDRMATAVVMDMVYGGPARAAVYAVECGMAPADAYRFLDMMKVSLMGLANETLARMGVPPFEHDDEGIDWQLDSFDRVNWAHLAEVAGVPLDEAAWQAAALKANRERFGHA